MRTTPSLWGELWSLDLLATEVSASHLDLQNPGLTGIFFLPDDALTGSHRDGLSAMVPVQAILYNLCACFPKALFVYRTIDASNEDIETLNVVLNCVIQRLAFVQFGPCSVGQLG